MNNMTLKDSEENKTDEEKLQKIKPLYESPYKKNNAKMTLRKKVKLMNEKFTVITPFYSYEDYEDFSNKTIFKLIWIDCPAKIRFSNFQKKYKNDNFEKFLEEDFKIAGKKNIRILRENASVHISNDSSFEEFINKISNIFTFLCNNLRPQWDDYFMNIAHIVSNRSNCIKQKVGAIVVKNNRILSTGYNGTPSKIENCIDGECPRCNSDEISQGEQLDKCFCIHAEENALLEIGKTLLFYWNDLS